METEISGLRSKTILIISPQSWGAMFVAKHHYAIELAKLGNVVYFLNPPDNKRWLISNKSRRVAIQPSVVQPNLHLIWHKLYFPYQLKFHAPALFEFFIQKQIKNILDLIGKPITIVWSFDLGNLYPLKNFPNSFKIFHPVDEPQNMRAIRAAENADILFTVTNEIIDKYRQFQIPKFFINHGVAEYFFEDKVLELGGERLKVGLSGNLLRPDIDKEILWKIISENPTLSFEFWGAFKVDGGNLGGEANEDLIKRLETASNVKLHGPVSSRKLAAELKRMDAFLICYDIEKDQSHGTNYHKVMEYLSTGKVIISNNITTYQDMPNLVQMVKERNTNENLPRLFKHIVENIREYNAADLMAERIAYAYNNRYPKQLERISEIISNVCTHQKKNSIAV